MLVNKKQPDPAWKDVRCSDPACGRLLCRAKAGAEVQAKCQKCGRITEARVEGRLLPEAGPC